uniref:Uncharacterized protein n=1 Tax=Ditylenchus dipsaci TaxID=166011 RepID=A0A915DIZ3_9BILA
MAETSSESDIPEEAPAKFTPDVKFSSTGKCERQGPSDMGATARSEIDTESTVDAQAQFERNQQMLRDAEAIEATSSKNFSNNFFADLQGMALYGAKLKEDTVKGNASSGLNRKGPIRATQFMRANVRWDYAPDICKDYKETGFCTFGDSCKFMHDRGDYKHGWEIERDYEASKLTKVKDDEFVITSDEDEDKSDLPHHCFICRESFKNPVITKCKHYFCESCAIGHYRKSKRCAVCNVKTDGIFSTAKDIIAKMGAKKEDTTEAGSENSDEDQVKEEAAVLPMEETLDDEEEKELEEKE